MNFISNLFDDIINQRVSSSSRTAVHASFICAAIAELYFYFTVPASTSIHFLVLLVLTLGAYAAISWFVQRETQLLTTQGVLSTGHQP